MKLGQQPDGETHHRAMHVEEGRTYIRSNDLIEKLEKKVSESHQGLHYPFRWKNLNVSLHLVKVSLLCLGMWGRTMIEKFPVCLCVFTCTLLFTVCFLGSFPAPEPGKL